MANPPPVKPDEEAVSKKKRAEQTAAAVSASVINILGCPANLFRVSAVRLWGDYYRVNVQIGSDPVSTSIAHSFFIVADEKGNVTESTPKIVRVY
jgi:hypothetical protein